MDVYLHSVVCYTQDSVSCSSNHILCVDTVSGDLFGGRFPEVLFSEHQNQRLLRHFKAILAN